MQISSIWKQSVRRLVSDLLPFPNAIMGLRPRSLVRSIHYTKQLTAEDLDLFLLTSIRERRMCCWMLIESLGWIRYKVCFCHQGQQPNGEVAITHQDICTRQLIHLQHLWLIHGDTASLTCRLIWQYLQTRVKLLFIGVHNIVGSGNRSSNMVRRQRRGTSARANNGDLGATHPIESRTTKSWNKVQYVTNSTVEAVSNWLSKLQVNLHRLPS